MKLLDLFCGSGGSAMGYHLAGFDIVGVDINPQPRFPFEFIQADAMSFPLDGFEVIHASPPCQRYSSISKGMGIAHLAPDLVGDVRNRLEQSNTPFVIENVIGAPLRFTTMLCGSMFGLGTCEFWLRRHRLFECSTVVLAPSCQHPKKQSIGVYGNGTNQWHRDKIGRNITAEEARESMGIDWMTRKSLSQAIPPAYTKYIGKQLIKQLQASPV